MDWSWHDNHSFSLMCEAANASYIPAWKKENSLKVNLLYIFNIVLLTRLLVCWRPQWLRYIYFLNHVIVMASSCLWVKWVPFCPTYQNLYLKFNFTRYCFHIYHCTFRRLLSTTRSPYQVLDIPQSASKSDVKKAYIAKAKKV